MTVDLSKNLDNISDFPLGTVVTTASLHKRMENEPEFYNFVIFSLDRFRKSDWGDICTEDKKLNDYAVKNGARILAAYIYSRTNEKIWIISEADRSATTILFPNEY